MDIASAGHRRRRLLRLCGGLLSAIAVSFLASEITPASAMDCPGNPNALGTSRTLVVDPTEHPRIGTMQYRETLPLGDHEVVLTFDDGPLPFQSNHVLKTLASECVKATFFIVGHMAHKFPESVRRLRDAGHTIGTHSENHPLTFDRMPLDRVMQEVNGGIDHTAAALGDPNAVAPFFRIPGLLRADSVENYLASRGIMTWSADFPADDWRHISSAQVLHLALTRLEAKGKGVLLLHDIQARTAAMLPAFLRELKARGYRIVHVVPATPERPKTPTEPKQWLRHPEAIAMPVASWDDVPRFVFTNTAVMVAPGLASAEYADITALSPKDDRIYRRVRFGADTVPLPPEPAWPKPTQTVSTPTENLPAPDRAIFHLAETTVVKVRLVARRLKRSHRHRAQNTVNPSRS